MDGLISSPLPLPMLNFPKLLSNSTNHALNSRILLLKNNCFYMTLFFLSFYEILNNKIQFFSNYTWTLTLSSTTNESTPTCVSLNYYSIDCRPRMLSRWASWNLSNTCWSWSETGRQSWFAFDMWWFSGTFSNCVKLFLDSLGYS